MAKVNLVTTDIGGSSGVVVLGQSATVIGGGCNAMVNLVSIGAQTMAHQYGVAIGNHVTTFGTASVAIGSGVVIYGDNKVAIGSGISVSNTADILIGGDRTTNIRVFDSEALFSFGTPPTGSTAARYVRLSPNGIDLNGQRLCVWTGSSSTNDIGSTRIGSNTSGDYTATGYVAIGQGAYSANSYDTVIGTRASGVPSQGHSSCNSATPSLVLATGQAGGDPAQRITLCGSKNNSNNPATISFRIGHICRSFTAAEFFKALGKDV